MEARLSATMALVGLFVVTDSWIPLAFMFLFWTGLVIFDWKAGR